MLSYRTGVYSLANIWYNRNMEKIYLLSKKTHFHMVEAMCTHCSIILSGVQNTGKRFNCKPQFFISGMIKIMKENLARQLFLSHPELKKQLWGGHLWNPSYCAVTVSDRSREQILTYIEGQKEKEKTKSS